jgi:hypothetical protein
LHLKYTCISNEENIETRDIPSRRNNSTNPPTTQKLVLMMVKILYNALNFQVITLQRA